MTITLELPDHLQKQAEALAAERGESVEAVALDLLETSLAIHLAVLPPRTVRMQTAVPRIRALALECGLDWDQMSEEERERLIDVILHE